MVLVATTNEYKYFESCRSHRFRNVQVEVLYQRYFLRMNQNNMVSLLGLLICISLALIVTNHMLYASTQSSLLQVSHFNSKIESAKQKNRHRSFDTKVPKPILGLDIHKFGKEDSTQAETLSAVILMIYANPYLSRESPWACSPSCTCYLSF